MAVLRFPSEDRVLDDESEIRISLAALGIDYERWDLSRVPADAPASAVLAAYSEEIDDLKRLPEPTRRPIGFKPDQKEPVRASPVP